MRLFFNETETEEKLHRLEVKLIKLEQNRNYNKYLLEIERNSLTNLEEGNVKREKQTKSLRRERGKGIDY